MPSRRRAIQLAGGVLVGLAGCTSAPPGTPGSPTDSPTTSPTDNPDGTPTPTDEPPATTTPDDPDPWSPAWTIDVPEGQVIGLDRRGDRVYAALSNEGGPSAVAAIDVAGQQLDWRTPLTGEAVSASHVAYRPISRGQWGVTPTESTVLAVAGNVDNYEWSALTALDRATGESLWSFQRPRRLSVAGVAGDTVVATALEFFEPENTHDTPEDPLTTDVYALDIADGTVRWSERYQAVREVAVAPDGTVAVAAGARLVGLGSDGTRRFERSRSRPARLVRSVGDGFVYATKGDDVSDLLGVGTDGTVRWEATLPVGEVLAADDRLFAGGADVYELDPTDGKPAWSRDPYGKWLLLDPTGGTLYTRAAVQSDAVDAIDAATGESRWRFDPPSNNAWPLAATGDAAVAQAITPEDGNDAFYTLYAVDAADGRATKATPTDTVFDAVGVGDLVLTGSTDGTLRAYRP